VFGLPLEAVGSAGATEGEGEQVYGVQREGLGRVSVASDWWRGACPRWEMEVQRLSWLC
jgi:hypothetical protein